MRGVKNQTLKTARKNKGMTQKQLAQQSDVNFRMIQKYEMGERDLKEASVSTVHKIALVLGLTIDELMGW